MTRRAIHHRVVREVTSESPSTTKSRFPWWVEPWFTRWQIDPGQLVGGSGGPRRNSQSSRGDHTLELPFPDKHDDKDTDTFDAWRFEFQI